MLIIILTNIVNINANTTDYETIPTKHALNTSDVIMLLQILKDVFVHGWSSELKSIRQKALVLKMARFSKQALLTKATDEAAAIVSNEPAADL
jgi:hypothetical protein